MIKRVFLIVLDSCGCGYEPDAELFGDVGANTLATIRRSKKFHCPNMEKLGLFHIDGFKPEEGDSYTGEIYKDAKINKGRKGFRYIIKIIII